MEIISKKRKKATKGDRIDGFGSLSKKVWRVGKFEFEIGVSKIGR